LDKYAIRLFGQRPPILLLPNSGPRNLPSPALGYRGPAILREDAWSASSVRKDPHPEPLP
jgi:hypothetical protein